MQTVDDHRAGLLIQSSRLFLSLGRLFCEGVMMSSTWPKHWFLTYKSKGEVS
jgi:hypothetical protein